MTAITGVKTTALECPMPLLFIMPKASLCEDDDNVLSISVNSASRISEVKNYVPVTGLAEFSQGAGPQ